MNWETVTSGLGQKVYALWNDGYKLLTLAFNSSSNFVKVEYGEEKRAFSLRYEGIFRNKMVMRNEYGVRLGQLFTDGNENFVDLEDERLYYTITREPAPRLILYKESPEQPVAECELAVDQEKGVLPSRNADATTHSLLLALSWYLLSPFVRQQAGQNLKQRVAV